MEGDKEAEESKKNEMVKKITDEEKKDEKD
jgi:hypothetical protein